MYEYYHYLPVDDSIMRWGLYLTGVGRGIIPSQDNYPPTGHPVLYSFNYQRGRILPEFQIILITDGKGTFESKETGPITIQPNTLIMLFPDIWHRYKPDGQTGWKERWISVNGAIIHSLMEQGYLSPKNPVFHLPHPGKLISSLDLFLDQVHCDATENTVFVSLSVMALLKEIVDLIGTDCQVEDKQYPKQVRPSIDPLVQSVLNIIWTQSHRPISVDSILSQIPASRRTLERRFQEHHGHSIHEEIVQCRLSRAKRLLRETQFPIKTTAYMSGFNSTEKMRRAFEKVLGQSPSEYRKQHFHTV